MSGDTSCCAGLEAVIESASSEKLQTHNTIKSVALSNMAQKGSKLPFLGDAARAIVDKLYVQAEMYGSNATVDNEKFVETFLWRHKHQNRCFALDCEMVQTSIGHELARVTLLLFSPSTDDKERYEVVIDELVKPRRPVLNYLTNPSSHSYNY